MQAARTIKFFGVYLVLTGLALLLFPNAVLGVFGAPEAKDGYIRLLGALAIVLGYYYWACGAANQWAFFKASVPGRVAFFVLGLALYLTGQLHWSIVLFGVVDLLGAAWTWRALSGHTSLEAELAPD